MRILQIVESLHNGAVENWLVNSFIEITKIRPEWEWTFYCIIEEEGKLERLVIENGGKIIKSPCTISNKKYFLFALKEHVKKNNFDVIHAHHDYMNAFYLLSLSRIKAYKISHIHNTDKHLPIRNRVLNKLFIPLLRILNNIGYDRLIGISQDTITEFKMGLSNNPEKDILYYGINLEKFNIRFEKDDFLKEFNLPENAKLLLFVGRFTELKNPSFVVDILYELNERGCNEYYALFIGEGNEKQFITSKAQKLNLTDRIRIIGWVEKPERFFQLCDVFVFPRKIYPKEGFGMVMLEAQASGIQTVVSNGVPESTIVNRDIVNVIYDDFDPKNWVEQILILKLDRNNINEFQKIESSKFNIRKSALRLKMIYEGKY